MRAALTRATDCADWPREGWRANIGLRAAFLDLEKATVDRLRNGAPIDRAALARLESLRCAVDTRAAVTRSAMLASAPVLFRNDVAHDPAFAALSPHFEAALADWSARLRLVLALAPERSDLAVPYLAALVQRGTFAEVERFAEGLLATNPQDPVGLWFSGLALVESPDPRRQKAGVARLKAGIGAGIERVLVVPEALKARILELSQGTG
jgi:hypothetical protein